MKDVAKLAIHLLPPNTVGKNWIEVDGRIIPAVDVMVTGQEIVVTIPMNRVDMVFEPPEGD